MHTVEREELALARLCQLLKVGEHLRERGRAGARAAHCAAGRLAQRLPSGLVHRVTAREPELIKAVLICMT